MIFFEIICFEFPCVAGAHLPKVGGSFSGSRWLIFRKSVAHFPEVGGSFSGSRWLIFRKSVAHFPEVGGSFSGSRWLIFRKSVAHFPKVRKLFACREQEARLGEPEKRYQSLKPNQNRETKMGIHPIPHH